MNWRMSKLTAYLPRAFNSGGANRYGLGVAWAPHTVQNFDLHGVIGPHLVRRWQARIAWGQVALWHDGEALVNWLNPLVWCRHGNGLHLRGESIECVNCTP